MNCKYFWGCPELKRRALMNSKRKFIDEVDMCCKECGYFCTETEAEIKARINS